MSKLSLTAKMYSAFFRGHKLAAISIMAGLALVIWISDHFEDSAFALGALGNFVGSFVAAFFGIPIALAIASAAADENRRAEIQLAAKSQSARRREILSMIDVELKSNEVTGDELTDNRAMAAKFRSDHLWTAFSFGGELRFIDDSKLLATIASAYRALTAFKSWQDAYLADCTYVGARNRDALGFIAEHMTSASTSMQLQIQTARQAILEALTLSTT